MPSVQPLTEEINDLIAVSYVLSSVLDRVEQMDEPSGSSTVPSSEMDPNSIVLPVPFHFERSPITPDKNHVASKMYDNSRLIFDTYIVKPDDVLHFPGDGGFLDSQSRSDSLEDFLRLELSLKNIPAEDSNQLLHDPQATTLSTLPPDDSSADSNQQPAEPVAQPLSTLSSSIPISASLEYLNSDQRFLEVPIQVVCSNNEATESTQTHQSPKTSPKAQENSLQEENTNIAQRPLRSTSVGLLTRLEQENEQLTEQVEVLNKLNDRITKKMEEAELKSVIVAKELESVRKEQMEQLEAKSSAEEKATIDYQNRISELEAEVAARDSVLENAVREKKESDNELVELRGKLSELESDSQVKGASESEREEIMRELERKLEDIEKENALMKETLKTWREDYPDVTKLSIVKSYFHPEMEKRAVGVLESVLEEEGLRDDEAAREISRRFGELYGSHWQCALFRRLGHGCFIFHNNNCYICFQLGNYHLVLFRY